MTERDADAEYRDYVRRKIERGLADAAAGRVISHEEAKRRLSRWMVEPADGTDDPPSGKTG